METFGLARQKAVPSGAKTNEGNHFGKTMGSLMV